VSPWTGPTRPGSDFHFADQSREPTVMKKRRKNPRRPTDEGSYTCPTCGEQIVIPLDPTAGNEQEYVEDCPVCCNPNEIHVEFFEQSEPPRVWADAE
jgi:hypothetical protein